MNVILVVSDTLRRDHLGTYGGAPETPRGPVHTPHLDALAADSVVFDRAIAASFPTGPMRQDLYAGRFTFPYQRWSKPLPEDPNLPAILRAAGARTALSADCPAIVRAGYRAGYDAAFEFPHWSYDVGGFNTPWARADLPAAPEKLRRPERVRGFIAQHAMRRRETDWFCGRTIAAAADWLEERCRTRDRKPFFLCVDTFDPHEPWLPPQWYLDRYDPDYAGEALVEPAYEPAGYCTEREIVHMRARYAAMVTMVDAWIGHLLWTVDRLDLRDDTAIVVTTDHGFYHGEHGLIGKVRLNREDGIVGRYPLYNEMYRIPFVVRVPGQSPGRRNALVQPPDFLPTICDIMGAPVPERVQGTSLVPIIRGERESVRDWAISSLTYVQDDACRAPSTLVTDEWSYVYGGDESPHMLFSLTDDPRETSDRFAADEPIARELHERYLAALAEIDCPPARIDGRRSWTPRPASDLPPSKQI